MNEELEKLMEKEQRTNKTQFLLYIENRKKKGYRREGDFQHQLTK